MVVSWTRPGCACLSLAPTTGLRQRQQLEHVELCKQRPLLNSLLVYRCCVLPAACWSHCLLQQQFIVHPQLRPWMVQHIHMLC